MNQSFLPIALAKELNKLENKDLVVKSSNNSLVISPQYLSYSFLSIYLFAIIPIALILLPSEVKFKLAGLALFLGFVYILFNLLNSSNLVSFDMESKKLTITPPVVLRLIKKKKIIGFRDISHFDFKDNGASPGEKRYVIFLKREDEVFNLISTRSEQNAFSLLKVMRLIIK